MRRIVGAALLGIGASVAYVGLLGLLEIHAEAIRSGARVDLSNQIVALSEPALPILQYTAISLVGALAAFCAIRLSRASRWREALAGCLSAVVTVSLLIWIAWQMASEFVGTPLAFAPAWKGWIQVGGQSAAVLLVVALLVYSVVLIASGPWAVRAEMRQVSSSD